MGIRFVEEDRIQWVQMIVHGKDRSDCSTNDDEEEEESMEDDWVSSAAAGDDDSRIHKIVIPTIIINEQPCLVLFTNLHQNCRYKYTPYM